MCPINLHQERHKALKVNRALATSGNGKWTNMELEGSYGCS